MKASQERDGHGLFAMTSTLVRATAGALRRAPLAAFTGPA